MRSAGILLPLFSLDGGYGIGTLGKKAYEWVDFIKECGFKWWQLLPLGPAGCGNSPYQCDSSFAGNPLFIDPELLADDGVLSFEGLEAARMPNTGAVDYDCLLKNRIALLKGTMDAGLVCYAEEYEAFLKDTFWLSDYALYSALRKKYGESLAGWPEDIRKRRPEALEREENELKEEVELTKYLQFLFFKQWKRLKTHANERGIGIIGDVPIYCAPDASDIWIEPHYFRLREDGGLDGSAGVPPDAFNEDGQLWGNPLYNWERIKQDGYGLWIRRIGAAAEMFDKIRIDHFRAFDTFFVIPNGATTAREGLWENGPGMELIGILNSWFPGLSFIAEDLGALFESVIELRKESGWPGMNVLSFAFESGANSIYLPHNHIRNSVTYIGTHDNDTLLGTLAALPEKDIAFAMEYLGAACRKDLPDAVIRAGLSGVSDLFVMQLQDILGLGSEGRINTPGTVGDNWKWRVTEDQLKKADPAAVKKLLVLYGRA